MKSLRRTLFATSLTASLAFALTGNAFSEAPVVDESENFALFEQQEASSPPADSRGSRYARANEETPLAHEEYTDSHSTGNNLALVNKIQGLQQDIQELRGQLEVQSHDLKALQQQQVEFYKDLDARLRHEPIAAGQPKAAAVQPNIEASTPLNLDEPLNQNQPTQSTSAALGNTLEQPSTSVATRPLPARANSTNEQVSYLAAYELINNKQFAEALPAMQTFVAQYPQGGYTANAHYWIGELYMVQKNYPEAIQQFEMVLQKFPTSSKSSASMLKIGYALAAAGELNAAKQRLQTVVKQYPDTHAAQLALAKLESLGNR
jgi:tol-pal system protein YbgF